MDYRVLDSINEFEAAFTLEVAVWGLDPRDAVPPNMLRALTHAGGALIGAYDETRLIGIVLGFPARADSGWVLWSHMTGVQRSYQGQNVGFELKRFQREWALAHGFTEIRWTFDPLQRGNANFNLHRLGAVAEGYLVDFYGVMEDEINHSGLPSDRVEAVWRLTDPGVAERLAGQLPEPPPADLPFVLDEVGGLPRMTELADSTGDCLARIPARLDALPSAEAMSAWRLALRKTLMQAFARGYAAADFTTTNAYLLRRR
jgi:predicted GNAT superfamily acetyltransferase